MTKNPMDFYKFRKTKYYEDFRTDDKIASAIYFLGSNGITFSGLKILLKEDLNEPKLIKGLSNLLNEYRIIAEDNGDFTLYKRDEMFFQIEDKIEEVMNEIK
jgi:hypothetical protein